MASRLAYSVAFKAVREVLVLDEIFAVGDAGFKARCEERYRTFSAAGHTVIVVSHDPRIVGTFCSRALLLDGGRVILDGTGAEVAAAYLELILRAPHAGNIPASPVGCDFRCSRTDRLDPAACEATVTRRSRSAVSS